MEEKSTKQFQTVDDLSKPELLKVIEILLHKMKPNGQMKEGEFDMVVMLMAKTYKQPNFVIREGKPI